MPIKLTVSFTLLTLLASLGLPVAAWAAGWYLMVAPIKKNAEEQHIPDLSVPLKFWDQRRAFDIAAACEANLIHEFSERVLVRIAAAGDLRGPNADYYTLAAAIEKWLSSGDIGGIPEKLQSPIARAVIENKPGYSCIATDDPRLR